MNYLRSQSNLKNWNFKSNFFLVHGVPIRLKWRGNVFFFFNTVFERNLRLILCANIFCQNLPWKKKIMKIRSSLIWSQSKKCKICVKISQWIYVCSCLWEAAMQECFQNKFVLRSSLQDAFFNIAVLHLWWNSLKNTCDEVRFLINLHVTLSNFELYDISAEKLYNAEKFHHSINAEQKLLQKTSRKLLLRLEAVVRRYSSK